MKIHFYDEKLQSSEQFAEFKQKNPNAYLMAGVYSLELESGKNNYSMDFFIPEDKKVAAFNINGEITLKILDPINENIPEKLDLSKLNLKLQDIELMIQEEMHNKEIQNKLTTIIAVIQTIGGKSIWQINCVLSGMSILQVHIEDDKKIITKFEKKSIFDFVKKA